MPALHRNLLRLLVSAGLVAVGLLVMNLPAVFRGPGSPTFPLLDPFAVMVDSGEARIDGAPADSLIVLDALRPVQDPEIDIGIVDLGLVHRLEVDTSGNVILILTLTVPECPFARVIALRAMTAVKAVPGVRRIEVRLDPSVGWTPARLSPEARQRFQTLFPDEPGTGR